MSQDQSHMPMDERSALFELRRTHGHAIGRLDRFVREHPYMIAPNVIALIRHNLQDNLDILEKAETGQEGGPS